MTRAARCSLLASGSPAFGAFALCLTFCLGPQAPSVDLPYCLRVARGLAPADGDRCPGFIVDGLAGTYGALQQCEEVGGELVANGAVSMRAIDVNGDGRAEFLFDLAANFGCDGAPSIFSCGSLGCPLLLYEERGGKWSAIGALDATVEQTIEVLPLEGNQGYRELRVGCYGESPCDEFIHYQWTGVGYEQSARQVRGFWVDVSGSVHGLWNLVCASPVLATPTVGSPVLERYEAGTEVAIIGRARGASYYYVSPCNACESGFVEESAVRAWKAP